MTVGEFLASEPRLPEFWTPLVVLDEEALKHNLLVMAQWTTTWGLLLMPHGKTTMAPALWRRQLDAGCAGITLANMGQVRTARHFGVDSIMLANEVVDARSLAFLAEQLGDSDFRFTCWVDSIAAVQAMDASLRQAGAPRRVNVCVELGAAGGRAGVRTVAEAFGVGRAIAQSDFLRLAGVSGFEGILGHDRSEESLRVVRDYLKSQLDLHRLFEGMYDDSGPVYVTAGGSAYFDLVSQAYAEARQAEPYSHTRFTLRSGCYIVHDQGFYQANSPLGEVAGTEVDPTERLRPAMFAIVRVVSTPEPGLALLDGGKRDFGFDEGLPTPLATAPDLGDPWTSLDGAIFALNDQHAYLRHPATTQLNVGDVVYLGLSHPCTTFDKWRLLPVVASATDTRVVDLIQTFF